MFACIFIPDFSVQAIIRFEPELRMLGRGAHRTASAGKSDGAQ
jgi:hypothetical protein